MLVKPKVRGFMCTTAHPAGCAANVNAQINYVKKNVKIADQSKKNVLVIGASTGYGLASRINFAFGANANTLGIFFERKGAGVKTASAGWYNSAAFEQAATKHNLYAKSINGDAFADETKHKAIEMIKQDWNGKVDAIVYSLASPRRKDPKTGIIYNSTLKPIGSSYSDKTVDVMSGKVTNVTIDPAATEEIDSTIKVMGGEDWSEWIKALHKAGVLANNCLTIAYTYIGPEMTYPIYHHGTIGKAKADLEKHAEQIMPLLAQHYNGKALISVNKALVTQASAAIPVVPLYISLLYKVMKEKGLHEGCIEQMSRLFTQIYSNTATVDKQHRIRIDDLEMRDDVQEQVKQLWQQVATENLEEISDITGYRKEFYNLFGFEVPTIDYEQEQDISLEIPSCIEVATT